jgi:hypothetical protein
MIFIKIDPDTEKFDSPENGCFLTTGIYDIFLQISLSANIKREERDILSCSSRSMSVYFIFPAFIYIKKEVSGDVY